MIIIIIIIFLIFFVFSLHQKKPIWANSTRPILVISLKLVKLESVMMYIFIQILFHNAIWQSKIRYKLFWCTIIVGKYYINKIIAISLSSLEYAYPVLLNHFKFTWYKKVDTSNIKVKPFYFHFFRLKICSIWWKIKVRTYHCQ